MNRRECFSLNSFMHTANTTRVPFIHSFIHSLHPVSLPLNYDRKKATTFDIHLSLTLFALTIDRSVIEKNRITMETRINLVMFTYRFLDRLDTDVIPRTPRHPAHYLDRVRSLHGERPWQSVALILQLNLFHKMRRANTRSPHAFDVTSSDQIISSRQPLSASQVKWMLAVQFLRLIK